MIVTANWVQSPDGSTHGIKEGGILSISVSGVVDAASVILADFQQVGNAIRGTPILIPFPVKNPDGSLNLTQLSIKVQRQGQTLAGKKYVLKTVGHDSGGQTFETDDVFSVF
jgi:hypothetical protein